MADSSFSPDWVSPPGETISDIIRERKLTEQQLANKLNAPVEQVSRLIDGREGLTLDMARKLESCLGGSTVFWLAREKRYREGLRALGRLATDKATKEWVESLPYKDMTRLGWVQPTDDLSEKVASS